MATDLLCSSDDEENVEQNVSSPDASSEDAVSDMEDCPVTSGVQYEDGVALPDSALPGSSSSHLLVSQPVRAEVPA